MAAVAAAAPMPPRTVAAQPTVAPPSGRRPLRMTGMSSAGSRCRRRGPPQGATPRGGRARRRMWRLTKETLGTIATRTGALLGVLAAPRLGRLCQLRRCLGVLAAPRLGRRCQLRRCLGVLAAPRLGRRCQRRLPALRPYGHSLRLLRRQCSGQRWARGAPYHPSIDPGLSSISGRRRVTASGVGRGRRRPRRCFRRPRHR